VKETFFLEPDWAA